MSVIEINGITKDYGNNKGVFDLSYSVNRGEVMGFLGPNGAGKTTTIRQLMGFIRPDKGDCTINGMDCTKSSAQIQKLLGYLPGEIAFMDDMTGIKFIKFIAEMKGLRDLGRAEELMARFELNPAGKIKKMSKGMKQKLGIVCAFMQRPEILILDEPTSGLDPLMQNTFIELILEEKQKGTTVLMSSHMFEEVEKACDRAAIIKEGRIVAVQDINTLKESKRKIYKITFESAQMAKDFAAEPHLTVDSIKNNYVTVSIQGDMMPFIKALGKYTVTSLDVSVQSLEDLFMHFYGGDK
ncbi:MAG: ABC transporter ATP-binding protein [Christensenellales bacterium]